MSVATSSATIASDERARADSMLANPACEPAAMPTHDAGIASTDTAQSSIWSRNLCSDRVDTRLIRRGTRSYKNARRNTVAVRGCASPCDRCRDSARRFAALRETAIRMRRKRAERAVRTAPSVARTARWMASSFRGPHQYRTAHTVYTISWRNMSAARHRFVLHRNSNGRHRERRTKPDHPLVIAAQQM